MVYVLTFLAFAIAAAYIAAPFRAGDDSAFAVAATPAAVGSPPTLAQRHRVEMAVEAEILIMRARGRMRAAKPIIPIAAWECEKCGRGMGEGDKFCASCGTAREQAMPDAVPSG